MVLRVPLPGAAVVNQALAHAPVLALRTSILTPARSACRQNERSRSLLGFTK